MDQKPNDGQKPRGPNAKLAARLDAKASHTVWRGSTEVLGLYGLMIGCDSVLMWNFVAVCVKVLIASAYLPSGKTGKGTSSKSSVKSETQVPFSFETAWPE